MTTEQIARLAHAYTAHRRAGMDRAAAQTLALAVVPGDGFGRVLAWHIGDAALRLEREHAAEREAERAG